MAAKIRYARGFTIIELVVVIAIIGILAALVLVNVTQYFNKSKNSAVKSNLSSSVVNAALFYDDPLNDGYVGFCAGTLFQNIGEELNNLVGSYPVCEETSNDWCACSALKITEEDLEGSTFCVDSSGYKKVTLTDCLTRCVGGICGE